MNISKKTRFLFLALYDEYALGLRLLASILQNAGYETKILMFKKFSLGVRRDPMEIEWDLLAQAIRDYAPDVVGVSMLSIHVIDEPRLFNLIRQAAPQALVISGGFGPTLEPEKFLKFGVDYIIRGEGEEAILEIADSLEAGRDLKEMKNVGWLENGELRLNPLRPLYDLAGLPFAYYGDKDIIYIDDGCSRQVDPMLTLEGIYLTNTSRGCTGKCTYCAGGNWLDLYLKEHGSCIRYRKRPVEAVISECERAKSLGATYILFMDEYFVRPEKEYFHYFDEYKKRVELPFGLMVHTGFMEKDPARFEAFFTAGVHNVEIGVQSASSHIAQDVFHRKISLDTQLKTIRLLYDHWVSTQVDFITGHSLESEADFLETVNFVKDLPFDPSWPARCHIEAFALAHLPGATIHELYPEIITKPMPIVEKEFRQRILYIRHILKDDGAFNGIFNNKAMRAKPILLKNVFISIFNRLNAEYWRKTLERLKNKKVFFFGAGESYQIYKYMFRDVEPMAILIDRGTPPKEIDGLPVENLDEALADSDQLPIIMFTSTPGIVATKILRHFPRFTDLIPCYNVQYPQFFLA